MWNCCIETKAPQRADVATRCGVASRDYEQAAIHDRDTQLHSIVIGVLIGAAAQGVGVALGVAVALVLHHAFG